MVLALTVPAIATLWSQGKLAAGIFSFRLAPTGSQLYLGGIDSSKFTGSIAYAPATQRAWWTVAMTSAGWNGGITGRSAIIDTGTTLVYCSTSDAASFYAQYPGAVPLSAFGYTQYSGYYAVPCSGTSYAALTFGGRKFTIPLSVFTYFGYIGSRQNKAYCVGGVIGYDGFGFGSTWLVGDVFLQSTYTIFDFANNRVGFATPI